VAKPGKRQTAPGPIPLCFGLARIRCFGSLRAVQNPLILDADLVVPRRRKFKLNHLI
jgi:hypothetical protein